MKKLIIGRNNTCDIVVPDTSDLVSRKHAVLMVSFMGKMTLYNTGPNGTYVNGQKLEGKTGVCVTRKDKVNFAQVAELDWSKVPDPYHNMKLLAVAACLVVAVAASLLAWWITSSEQETEPAAIETEAERGETVTTVEEEMPAAEEPDKPEQKERKKPKNKKKKSPDATEVMNNDLKKNTPIVY